MATSPQQRSAIAFACDEAETALRLFLQGRFDEAEKFIEERAKTRDSIPSAVPIFTHCHAVILFAKAGITGTEEDRKQAMERLQHASTLAGENIPKQGWAQSIASWGMGYFASQSPKSTSISEKELSCRVIEAEATYLSALLCFFEESLAAFFKAALLIRRAIRGYKHCNTILQNNGNSIGNEHDIGAVKLGFGGFSLAISMLPPKLLRLLSVLGFPSNRKAGLNAIEEALRSGGLRASVSGVLLLSYHVILPAFFSIPLEREQHVQAAECILSILDQKYPNSFFLSFYKGRLQRLKGDLEGSVQSFLELDKGLILTPESKFFKLRHAWVYELGVSYMLQLKWEEAQNCWVELEKDSVWSRAFFAYMHGVCLSMQGLAKEAADKFAKVQGLMRGTMSGKVLAEEQYVSRKVRDHALDTEEGVMTFQGRISGPEFLYMWNSFPQMPSSKLEQVIQIIDEAAGLVCSGSEETKSKDVRQSELPSWLLGAVEEDEDEDPEDDIAVGNLIKGTALRELGQLDASYDCLNYIREETCYVETELFVYPMAAYERALVLISRHTGKTRETQKPLDCDFLLEAKKELDIAEGFKQDYNFLWRLLGRVHAARAAIRGLLGEETKTEPLVATCAEEVNDEWSGELSDGTVESSLVNEFKGLMESDQLRT
ncbi:hypothetical protein KP509_21G073200 [Ceratopteris richardii]|uniref:Uncharacterized protein n=1 Tax=Ceratopteris richardii TaxID=49495 RepID=A0A8T2SBW0_CERRI|nr:hypothetical protein KP509_21G073200 [Ceratopteris richardii]